MYQPPHFIETNSDVLQALVRAHPLGLMISATPSGPVADPLPFLISVGDDGAIRLRAHLARANPHWKILRDNPDSTVLVVFQGSESYITPSWYETKRETGKVVPTWNYVTVQARGIAQVFEDSSWLLNQITELTATHEATREAPWQVHDAPAGYIESQMKGIVGLEIEVSELSGKWKVSQNRPVADRSGVAEGLEKAASGQVMAGLVRQYGKLD
ncbi:MULTISPECIES: FMN-binding negative transcriptional regulator [Mesorhizobium]|uniref:FMN-binding negative transcriptional regulator n=1 Tax=Mesorhizobium denitrificans TaxID=2294114 RepID=A0A371X6K7_9HYPH|nr:MULTISPECIES: FMN-binding negative transcriptional regulator [Mesorhizobium]RFC64865.1 FMN-binding negative transcriptional regulator [Mesorhizobium denitrificans]